MAVAHYTIRRAGCAKAESCCSCGSELVVEPCQSLPVASIFLGLNTLYFLSGFRESGEPHPQQAEAEAAEGGGTAAGR